MTEYDTFESGIGIGVYASEKGPVDSIKESSPIAINGVALPENTVLQGGQGVRHFYPPAMAKRAAEVLQQQLDDPNQTIHIVKNFHELEGQATADDIIGEVTSVGYEKGVGVRFGGEITDQEIAEKINFGYLDISPTIARALGDEMDDQMEARAVVDVAGFRDIAVVGQGQRGAGVEVGTNPAIEALARSPMPERVDTYEVSTPDFDGFSTGEWDAPTLEGTFDGDMDAARNSATWIDGEGETFDDLSLFVVGGDGECNVNALDSAWRLASQTDGPTEDDVARLRGLYEDLATDAHEAGDIGQEAFEETWVPRMEDSDDETDTNSTETDPAESGTDSDADTTTPEHDDGTHATESPSSAATTTEPMSETEDLTDEQRALLAAADSVEDATDVLNAYAAAEHPVIVENDTLEQYKDNLAELTQVFRDALSRQKDLPDAVVSDLGVDALTAAFRDDEGEIDFDTLNQQSETQTTAGSETDTGDGKGSTSGGFTADALSLSDREDLKRLKMKRTTFENRGMDKRVDALNAEMAQKAGVDDPDEIDWEVL